MQYAMIWLLWNKHTYIPCRDSALAVVQSSDHRVLRELFGENLLVHFFFFFAVNTPQVSQKVPGAKRRSSQTHKWSRNPPLNRLLYLLTCRTSAPTLVVCEAKNIRFSERKYENWRLMKIVSTAVRRSCPPQIQISVKPSRRL